MKLSIKNFAKIKEADIIIDGITVIAGENNTGKSTVGKILFSLFNSLSDIDEKILEERFKEIEKTNKAILQNYVSSAEVPGSVVRRNVLNIVRKINTQLREQFDEEVLISDESIFFIVENTIRNWQVTTHFLEISDSFVMIDEICKNIGEILNLPEEKIISEIISRYFNEVFHSQIQSLAEKESSEAVLTLEIKEKREKLLFENNYCKELVDKINIIHKAIYIDNPFIVDELSKYNDLNPMNKLLKDLLTSESKDGILDGVIETVRAKEKLANIYESLQNVVDGEIVIDQNDEFYLKCSGFDEPISFQNLSTGMKSFVILKMLLEKGCLKNKDVVILDEPEIHLHPQWQIAYAELIVLLQKQFELSVVVTTHSPYFVDAINLYSCKYGSDNRVNYYLSSNIENTVKMECVTGKIDLIYKKMASPIQMLDTLRYELNNK